MAAPQSAINASINLLISAVSGYVNSDSVQVCDELDLIPFAGALRATLTEFTKEFEKRITTIRRQHNALQPIHRLPEDVLLEIFDEVTKGDVVTHFRRLGRVALVSKSWWDLIDNSLQFWAFISTRQREEETRRFIDKSGEWPLTIEIGPEGKRGHIQPTDAFLRNNLHTAHRWRYANLHITDEPVVQMLNVSVPRLEKPQIKTVNVYPTGLTYFQGSAPRLRDLTILGTPIRSNPNLYTGLRTLTLTRLGGPWVRHSTIFHILAASPQLQVLKLKTIELSSPPEVFNSPSIHLPCLTQLTLVAVDGALELTLLEKVTAEGCTDFCWRRDPLHPGPPCGPEYFTDKTLDRWVPNLLRVLKSATSLFCKSGPSHFSLSTTNRGGGTLDLDIRADDLGIVIGWVIRHFKADLMRIPITLELTGSPDPLRSDYYGPRPYHPLSDLNVIRLVLKRVASGEFMSLFGTSTSVFRESPPFRHVRELDILGRGSAAPKLILETLQARYNPLLSDYHPNGGIPVPLDTLHVENVSYDGDVMTKLLDLIGDDKVTWLDKRTWKLPYGGNGDYHEAYTFM
ncbi:hypothetical protein FRB99_001531 [Tulasnella sp. 403]|nr:hypothetical protein FRB99_001531 [Tulasnella sp. 403]